MANSDQASTAGRVPSRPGRWSEHTQPSRQVFRSRRADDLVGLVHANLLVGVSFGWWVAKYQAFCTQHNVPYTEASLFGSYVEALRHLLHAVGAPLRPAVAE